MSQVAGPDFICIGMPKAGTEWLFDQLQYHPDFWMPPMKEIHYLDQEFPGMRNASGRLGRAEQRAHKDLERREKKSTREHPPRRRPGDERDVGFLTDATALNGQARNVASYAALFRYKGDLLSGDVSPGYCRVDDDVVKDVNQHLPGTKVVLLVRDPVARAWSRINMWHRDGKLDEAVLNDADAFRDFLKNSDRLRVGSFPTKIVECWTRNAPSMPFRYFLFDDIVGEPEKARREILGFLGADPGKQSGNLPANYNRKSKHAKLALTDIAKAALVDYFRDELKACAGMFGGPAKTWASQYGL